MDAKLDILEGTTEASLQRDDVWEDKSLSQRQEELQETNINCPLYAYFHVDGVFWA